MMNGDGWQLRFGPMLDKVARELPDGMRLGVIGDDADMPREFVVLLIVEDDEEVSVETLGGPYSGSETLWMLWAGWARARGLDQAEAAAMN